MWQMVGGGNNGGLKIIDISNPVSPIVTGSLDVGIRWRGEGIEVFAPLLAWSVTVAGDYAYVAGEYLDIINISNPALPVSIGVAGLIGAIAEEVMVAGIMPMLQLCIMG